MKKSDGSSFKGKLAIIASGLAKDPLNKSIPCYYRTGRPLSPRRLPEPDCLGDEGALREAAGAEERLLGAD
jgi:hypothetical protein